MSEYTGNIFRSVDRLRLSDYVAQQIEKAIREGRFLPGDALPAERALTVEFGISRPVLREALRRLSMQGLLDIQHGRGVFVKDSMPVGLAHSTRAWVAQHGEQIRVFYEARLVIEPECAAFASQRASDEDIASLKALIQQSAGALQEGTSASFISMDIDFHTAIAQMSGNPLLYRMLETIINPETDVRSVMLRLDEHRPLTQEGHERILHAIERRDPSAARRAMVDALNEGLEYLRGLTVQKEEAV
ncbi:MAG TPA: FadR/GntR family transcriptional regulator [Chloroflexota bacterium]